MIYNSKKRELIILVNFIILLKLWYTFLKQYVDISMYYYLLILYIINK